MFGSKRPGKRSIVGTKVCAIFDDQFYRPGSIQSVQIPVEQGQEQTYSVVFDEGGCGVYKDYQLIGPGFRSLCADQVKIGQKIYLTYNNREVKGSILGTYPAEKGDETPKYWIVGISNDVNTTVKVKLEDIRLVESRKSARLCDQDMDYTRMADVNESKKRSSFIDVPQSCHKHSKHASSGHRRDMEMEVMDENMAAMVLTSLSHNLLSHPCPIHHSPDSSPNEYSCSSPNDSLLSQSAPSSIISPPFQPYTPDYFSNYGSNSFDLSEEDVPSEISKRIVYQCTWPGCKQIYNTCNGIEKHIRFGHLGTKVDSEHEEEFYYTEVEVSMDASSSCFKGHHDDDSNEEEVDVTPHGRRKLQSDEHNTHNPYNLNITKYNPTYDHNYQKRACVRHTSPVNNTLHNIHFKRNSDNNYLNNNNNNNIYNNNYTSNVSYHGNNSNNKATNSNYTNNSNHGNSYNIRSRNDTFNYSAKNKRHSFNSVINNRNNNTNHHDNTLTARQRCRQSHRHTDNKEDSEEDISELSKSLPWTFPEQMDVDFCSDVEDKASNSAQPPTTPSTTPVPSTKATKPSHLQLASPSLTSAIQRKGHAEVKKCRKVYGLDNKAAWCTQCKWKKACSRFHHKGPGIELLR